MNLILETIIIINTCYYSTTIANRQRKSTFYQVKFNKE